MAREQAKAWLFTRGQWAEIDDPLDAPGNSYYDRYEDTPQAFRAAYYRKTTEWYNDDMGMLDLTLWAKERFRPTPPDEKPPEYPYVVELGLTDNIETIYIADFPSLVMFLNQVVPIGLFDEIARRLRQK